MKSHRVLFFVSTLLLLPFSIPRADSAPVIAEFLAINESDRLDEDGDPSPWIEIVNPDPRETVDLSDFHLTNDPQNRTLWRLPDTELTPGGFAIVFASGKNRRNASSEWHASFKLAEEEGYLALVGPGDEVVSVYENYPKQEEDMAYGRETTFSKSQNTLLGSTAHCRVIVPHEEMGITWTKPNFDDQKWIAAETGIGMERGRGYETLFGKNGNLTRHMYGINASVYLRIPFNFEATWTEGSKLILRMKYDDGFVAYLNGSKVSMVNAPPLTRFNSSAMADNPDSRATVFEEFDLTPFGRLLKKGTNLLAIHGLNGGATSSDVLILPELVSVEPSSVVLGDPGYLPSPSPGEPNRPAFRGFIGEVRASESHGFFDQPFELTLESDEGEIRYTTDGEPPTPGNGNRYDGPITIDRTTVLRAAVVKEGYKSEVLTRSYLFLSDIIDQSSDDAAPEGWPSRSVNRQIFNYGMDPDVVGKLHSREEVVKSLKAIPTASITISMNDLVGPEKGIYVNALEHGREWERPASLEMIYPDGRKGFQINAGLRIRGGYTRNPHFYKHAFRMFFRNEYGQGKLEYPVFGAEGADRFDNLDFRTAANHSWARRPGGDSSPRHNTFVRDVFARDTQSAMGQPYTRSRYYHLYLNGIYWGIYQSQERPKAAYGETYFDGDKEDYDAVKCGNRSMGYRTEATDGNMDAWNQLWGLSVAMRENPSEETYYKMLGCDATGRRDPNLPVLLDPENLIDYMLTLIYMGDGDAALSRFLRYRRANNWHSVYHRKGDSGFQFFCHDGEHTMDVPTAVYDRTGPFEVGPQSQAYSNPEWVHYNLLGSEEYRQLMADRIEKHFFDDGALTPERAKARFERRAAQVGTAMTAQSARWGDAQRSRPFTKSDWDAAVANVLQSFIPRRTETVIAHLKSDNLYPDTPAPSLSQQGQTVILTSRSAGTLLYTTDGADPRMRGGRPNPAAKKTASATRPFRVKLTQSATISARLRAPDGSWSPLTRREALIDEVPASEVNLRITEIMYRPERPGRAEKNAGHEDRSAFEFIELQNVGDEAVALDGVRFTNGIKFDFQNASIQSLPSKARLLVVKNREAFEHRYGKDLPIAGEYRGRLSNDGEPLGILATDGTPIVELTYNDKAPWPEEADGSGYSLTLEDPAATDSTLASHWKKSPSKGGSPGK